MSRNYNFLVDLARKRLPPAHDAKIRLLDFGCGAGQIVSRAREVGYAAEGVDTYAGGWGEAMAAGLQLEGVKHIPPSAPLPFEKGRFQVVISNMVLEHVRELGPVAAEVSRITSTTRAGSGDFRRWRHGGADHGDLCPSPPRTGRGLSSKLRAGDDAGSGLGSRSHRTAPPNVVARPNRKDEGRDPRPSCPDPAHGTQPARPSPKVGGRSKVQLNCARH